MMVVLPQLFKHRAFLSISFRYAAIPKNALRVILESEYFLE